MVSRTHYVGYTCNMAYMEATSIIDGLLLGYKTIGRQVKQCFSKAGRQNCEHISPVYKFTSDYHLLRLH